MPGTVAGVVAQGVSPRLAWSGLRAPVRLLQHAARIQGLMDATDRAAEDAALELHTELVLVPRLLEGRNLMQMSQVFRIASVPRRSEAEPR